MGLTPRSRDDADRLIDHGSRIQFQEIRRQPSSGVHTVTHTLLRPADLVAGEYIPPMIVQIDPLGDTPETKEIVGLGYVLRVGTMTLNWVVNGSAVTTSDLPLALADLDEIRPTVSSVSGAVDLSAYVTIRITPGG